MHQNGVCVWLTGRSGAGKSTVTRELVPLLEAQGRTVSVLDVMPELAKHWAERSSEGKLIRKAVVAREVARHGGIAICVTVSARAEVRERARSIVGDDSFLEIYFDTPADVAASRKAARKKKPPLLKRMRHSLRRVKQRVRPAEAFEEPASPDLVVDATTIPPEVNAQNIVDLLSARGFLADP
ncbi:MAG: adenylyl-sulfate kinase [Actinomycetota bacterium]